MVNEGVLMIKNLEFEIVEISGEYMAIPVGESAHNLKGIVALNSASAFLLREMETQKSKQDLVRMLCSEFDVDEATAQCDVQSFIDKLLSIGVILEE